MVATMAPAGKGPVAASPEHAEDVVVAVAVAKMDKPDMIAKTTTCPTTHR